MWEQEGIGNWETGMVGRHSFLLFLDNLGHLNVLSINSFNLEMIMGRHMQFYVRLYHSRLLLSKGLR